jgi:hypothetical protein
MAISYSERDLENWVYRHPEDVYLNSLGLCVEKWLARQYTVPSGRIDLLGLSCFRISGGNNHYFPVVVELKNRPIRQEDILQVSRYAHDIDNILLQLTYECELGWPAKKILIVPETNISDVLLFEAFSVNVEILTFRVDLTANLTGSLYWSDRQKDYLNGWYGQASKSEIFQVFNEIDNPANLFEQLVNMKPDEGGNG